MCAADRLPYYGVTSPDTSSNQVGRCPRIARVTPGSHRLTTSAERKDLGALCDTELWRGQRAGRSRRTLVTQRGAASDTSCHREALAGPAKPSSVRGHFRRADTRAPGLGRTPERDTIEGRYGAEKETVEERLLA